MILFFFFLVLEEEEEEEETKGGGACDARLISVETRVGVMRFLSFFGGCFASTSLDGAVALGCCFSSTRTGVIRRLRFLDDALFFALARPSFDTKFKSVVCFDITTWAGRGRRLLGDRRTPKNEDSLYKIML